MAGKFEPFAVAVTRHADGYLTQYTARTLVGDGDPVAVDPQALARVKTSAALFSGKAPLPSHRDARIIGADLFDAVLPGRFRAAYLKARQTAAKSGAKLRLTVEYTDEPALHELPWEVLHDGGPDSEFCALDAGVAFSRFVRQPEGARPMRAPGARSSLHSSAAPADQKALDFAAECERVEGPIRAQAGRAARRYVPHLTRERLRAELAAEPRDVWHHSGHGDLRPELGGFVLALERDGRTDLVPTAELLAAVRGSDLKFAFLNVCKGAHHVGLATVLAGINVPAVLGFRSSVLDADAVRFAQELYDLMFDHPLDWAVQCARRGFPRTQTVNWALPVLFLRTNDPSFFGPTRDLSDFSPSAPAVPAPATPTVVVPPPAPGGGVTVNVKLGARIKVLNDLTVGGVLGPRPTAAGAGPTAVNVEGGDELEAGSVRIFGEVNVPSENLAEYLALLKQLPE